MEFNVDPTRRRVLKAGASAAVVTTLASSSWMGLGTALAQQAKPLSFQLSWIKSIQYGGFFAGVIALGALAIVLAGGIIGKTG